MINSGREWDWMDKKNSEKMDIKTTSKSEVYWKNVDRYELEIGDLSTHKSMKRIRVATLHKVEDSNGGETIWMYGTEDLFSGKEVEYIEDLLWNDELEE